MMRVRGKATAGVAFRYMSITSFTRTAAHTWPALSPWDPPAPPHPCLPLSLFHNSSVSSTCKGDLPAQSTAVTPGNDHSTAEAAARLAIGPAGSLIASQDTAHSVADNLNVWLTAAMPHERREQSSQRGLQLCHWPMLRQQQATGMHFRTSLQTPSGMLDMTSKGG